MGAWLKTGTPETPKAPNHTRVATSLAEGQQAQGPAHAFRTNTGPCIAFSACSVFAVLSVFLPA